MDAPREGSARLLLRRSRATRSRWRSRARAFWRGVHATRGPPGLTNVEEEDEHKIEEVVDSEEKGHDTKNAEEVSHGREQLSTNIPLWMRKSVEVTSAEYASFYKTLYNDWEDHLAVKHFSIEGQLGVHALLFVPRRAPIDLVESKKKRSNIKLYRNRVFVRDDSIALMPEWLFFVGGVVDSEEMPPNMSRETLLQILSATRKQLVLKCLEMFDEIAQNNDDYNIFHQHFGKCLQHGVHEDPTYQTKVAELLRYQSSNSGGELTSFKEYVDRMKEGQQYIYYITGENIAALSSSPSLSALSTEGIEVLFIFGAVAESAMQQVKEFDGIELRSLDPLRCELASNPWDLFAARDMFTLTVVSRFFFNEIVDAWLDYKVDFYESLPPREQADLDRMCAGRMYS